MSCPTCVNGSCPEVPTTITIDNTTVDYNGANAGWREESFLGSAAVNDKTFTLSYYPVDANAVMVFLNSGAQRLTTDFTIDGNIISFVSALLDEDVVYVRYFSYDAEVSAGNVSIGQILWQASTTMPSGFCAADGATAYTIADYPSLYAYATTNSLIDSEDATTFTLVDLGMTVGAITLYAAIKN